MSNQQSLFPIGEVANITGIKPITLRAWERRYGLIEPVRTEGGHRLYTQQHIDTIQAAIKLTETGVPIGQAKKLIEKTEAILPTELDENYDYAAQLSQALAQHDLVALITELDRLFSDTPDSLQTQILTHLTLAIPVDDTLQQTLWQNELLPRLYTRLRLLTRAIPVAQSRRYFLHRNRIDENPVLITLIAIQLAKTGIFPILDTKTDIEDGTLFEQIKTLRAEALVLVDSSAEFDDSKWIDWVDQHSSIEFHYYLKENKTPQLSKKLQCHFHSLTGDETH